MSMPSTYSNEVILRVWRRGKSDSLAKEIEKWSAEQLNIPLL